MSESEKSGGEDRHVMTLNRAFVCPRCTVLYGADEGCDVCDYDGELDVFEVPTA